MLDSILTSGLTLPTFLICTAASLILGLLTALVCMYRQRCSRGFAVTLAILPAMVQMVILLVNGNIGAGVAVAGAFSLVRFRSVPGTAREIGAIFLAMAIGLATGMGYVALAAIFFVIVVTSVRSPAATRSLISASRSSICPSTGRTSILGSSKPVGRMICSTTPSESPSS